MSKLKSTIIFLLGAAAGGCSVWFYLKEKYSQISEQDITSAREAFHDREVKLQTEIDELKAQMSNKSEVTPQQTVLTVSKVEDKGDIADFTRAKYQQYTPAASQMKSTFEKDVEAPYVISPDEFGEIGYTQVSLTFYADSILADENGYIVDDIEEIVGDALEHFGEYEEDSVFCRSDPKRCDYEILKDLRRYAEVRKNYPPNL